MATELGTALGTLPFPDPASALAARPDQLHIDGEAWDRFGSLHGSGRYAAELSRAFANGRALLEAPDGLRGRTPRSVEWTGGRRPPGDEVAPIDLRIDHVYLVSCKYESDILANVSPARIFDGLLATTGSWDRGDWYDAVAPVEYAELYRACVRATGLSGMAPEPAGCSKEQLATLRAALPGRTYPDTDSRAAYTRLCVAVSTASAHRWCERLATSGLAPETMLWRLLRIGSAPYFVLGHDRRSGRPARFRIASPWDWREEFELVGFDLAPGRSGPAPGGLGGALPVAAAGLHPHRGRSRRDPVEPRTLRPTARGQGVPRHPDVVPARLPSAQLGRREPAQALGRRPVRCIPAR